MRRENRTYGSCACCVAALVALTLLVTQSASAQSLEVSGEDGCVTADALRAAMKRYRNPRATDDSLGARVQVAPGRMAFTVQDGDELLAERQFERVPKACAARVRALAIALVLAFENARAERDAAASGGAAAQGSAGSAEPAGAQAEVAPSTQASEAPTQVASSPPARTKSEARDEDDAEARERERDAGQAPSEARRVRAQAGAGVLVGVLPATALALRAGVEAQLAHVLALEAGAIVSPGTTTTLSEGEVRTQLYAARVALCAGVPVAGLRASACVGAAGGVVPAQGRGYALQSESARSAWLAGLAAIALDLPIVGPLGLRAAGDVLAAAVRPTLRVMSEGGNRDDTSSVVQALVSVQLLWALP